MKASENPIISVDASYFAIVAMAQATGDVRYYLDGVYVEPSPDKKGAVIVATNGHYLIAMHDRNGICVESKILKTDKRLLRDCGKKGLRWVVVDETGIMQVHEAVKGHISYQLPEQAFIDGRFPDWRRVIPSGELTPGLPNAFNPEYLKVFLDAGRKMRGPVSFFHDPAKMEDGYSTATTVVRSGSDDFMGLIMPMKAKVSSVLPSWGQPKAEKKESKSARKQAA